MARRAGWLERWSRRLGPHGAVWRARDHLETTLLDSAPDTRGLFHDLLPAIDALLAEQLPQLAREAATLERFLARVDVTALEAAARKWERSLSTTADPALREVRQGNLELAREQLARVRRIQTAVQRYHDRLAGMALAVDEAASRVAAFGIGEESRIEPELQRLRGEIEELTRELADLSAEV
ncbi:MAG: hypothetical protein HYU66_09300 [Armatimonadetes bacterium]|nr:hypothetical protein [Armatimonadota bacterium]